MTTVETTPVTAFASALGDQLRLARQQRGWSRKQLVAHLGVDISVQTVASYELGTRQCSVARLVELCQAMGVHAHDLLAHMHKHGSLSLTDRLVLDLTRAVQDEQPELRPLHRWARQWLAHARNNQLHAVLLDSAALEPMAELCGMSTDDLIERLRQLDCGNAVGTSEVPNARAAPSEGERLIGAPSH
ncbi:MAG: helix-turn-helix transcriptional regulator [Kibdelosporangium sp.]